MAVGLRSLKPTPYVVSFMDKADLACKGLVCTGPATHPEPAREGPTDALSPKLEKSRF